MNELTKTQLENLEYFHKNIGDFVNNSGLRFKHAVIANEEIAAAFDGIDAAVKYAVENLKKGDYIIQQIINEDDIVNFV